MAPLLRLARLPYWQERAAQFAPARLRGPVLDSLRRRSRRIFADTRAADNYITMGPDRLEGWVAHPCDCGMHGCLATGRRRRHLTFEGRLRASGTLPIGEHRHDAPERLRNLQGRHRPVLVPHHGADGGCRVLPRAAGGAGRNGPAARLVAANSRLAPWLLGLHRPGPCDGSGDRVRIARTPCRPISTSTRPRLTWRSSGGARLCLRSGGNTIVFDPHHHIFFDYGPPLPGHPNGMEFHAVDAEGVGYLSQIYYSIGGGFIVTAEELARGAEDAGDDQGRAGPLPVQERRGHAADGGGKRQLHRRDDAGERARHALR